MKKLMLLVTLLTASTTFTVTAQNAVPSSRSQRKAQREAERARLKAQEEASETISYQEAVQALQNRQFVLEANQVMFRSGETAYVTSTTNFVLVNEQRGTVQVAFNTPYPGPNGIGGITVDGQINALKTTTDKRGNLSTQFNIQGIGISAQIFITLPKGNNRATVTVSPNFNGNTLTLSGQLVPLNQSSIFKGRSW